MRHLDPQTLVNILGGSVTGKNTCNVPGPGHSKGDLSLSVRFEPSASDGFVVYSHASANDDPLRCKDYVRAALGLGAWRPGDRREAPIRTAASGPDPDKEKKKAWALKIWNESVNPVGKIVERYLREHRGLELGDDLAGRVIRYHAGLKYDDAYIPGMVCLLRDILTDEPCGIHRTFLDRKTAEKIDRKMLGVAKGAAIKFDAAGDHLTIGEGVETVLSARMMGLGPVWALGSSGEVGRFPVLKGLTKIGILEERDPTSRRDVEICTRRYLTANRSVSIHSPGVGNDMNDELRASL